LDPHASIRRLIEALDEVLDLGQHLFVSHGLGGGFLYEMRRDNFAVGIARVLDPPAHRPWGLTPSPRVPLEIPESFLGPRVGPKFGPSRTWNTPPASAGDCVILGTPKSERQIGQIVGTFGVGPPMPGRGNQPDPRPTESVVNVQPSVAAIAQTMDSASQLALRIGDQVKSAGKAEQDRQQRPISIQLSKRLIVSKLTLPSLAWVLRWHSPPVARRRNQGWARACADAVMGKKSSSRGF
jgi:hypothetical protein